MFDNHLFLKINRFAAAILLSLAVISTSTAQKSNGRISVTATGEAVAIPDQLEMLATLSAKEKTPAEAGEVFGEKREQLSNALNPMDFPGLEIKSMGKKIANTQIENDMVVVFDPGGPAEPKEVSYTAKESLRIIVKQNGNDFAEGIELLTRVEEQVSICGGTIGMPQVQYMPVSVSDSLIFASLSDRSGATERAWADAISKARAKAERLAKLSGLKLGKIVSVTEASDATGDPLSQFYSSMAGIDGGQNGSVGEIKVTASLIIEFAAN